MKTLTVRLSKEVIYNDINQRTYKRMEVALQGMSDTSKDAAASDTDEEHDASIISRYSDYRDSLLRKRLIHYITDDTTDTEFSNLPNTDTEYVYTFQLPDGFRSEYMNAIKHLMHEFIVRGATFDWYKFSGLQPSDTESDLEEVGEDILRNLGDGTDMTAATQHSSVLVRTESDGTIFWLISLAIRSIADQVDATTRKYTDAVELKKGGLRPDAVASKSSTQLDGALIPRYIAKWESELRRKLRFCLCKASELPNPSTGTGEIGFYFKFRKGFDTGILPDVVTMMHNYLVNGAVYEWYRSMNIQLSTTYLAETNTMQSRIVSMLRQAIPADEQYKVTLLATQEDGTLFYRIGILKESLLQEVDSVTRKYSDAAVRGNSPELLPDSISADHIGTIDEGIVLRYASKYAADLRMRLRFCLLTANQSAGYHGDDDYVETDIFLKPTFDVEILSSVASMMHGYLTDGALAEWYKSMGLNQSVPYASEAEEFKDKIVYALRGKPGLTRPLQPFGPPFPTTPLF